MSAGPAAQAVAKTRRHPIVKSLRHNYDLYLLLLPALAYLIIFKYAPMYGLQISFRDFNPVQGMWGSPWAGLKHFFRFFDSYMFVTVVRNTLALNLYQLLVGFPIPIMLALLLNQVPNQRFKKTVQTSIYAPHFISMVVMVGMLHLFLSPRSGLVNHAIGLLGAEPVYFFGKAGYFRSLYVWSDIWQNAGWGTIIYLAALSAVDPELHEAAIVDGATKLQRIRHIDIPGILPIVYTSGDPADSGDGQNDVDRLREGVPDEEPAERRHRRDHRHLRVRGGHRKRPVQLLRRGRLLQFRDQPDPADHGQPGRQEAERDQPVVSGRGHSVTRKTLKIDVQASPAGRHFRARP